MINPTPIEPAVGDFVCKACELPGEHVKAGDAVGRCSRCDARTYRRIAPAVESRSVQKRIAIMKGEPMPTRFDERQPDHCYCGGEGRHIYGTPGCGRPFRSAVR